MNEIDRQSRLSLEGQIQSIDARLGALRRLLRSSAALRGGSIFVLAALGTAAVSLAVDRAFRLSVPWRAAALAVYTLFLGWVAWKCLVRPLRSKLPSAVLADVAESWFPALQDAARSAVEFARKSGLLRSDDVEAAMRREVILQAASALRSTPLETSVDAARVSTTLGGALAAVAFASVFSVVATGTFTTWLRRNVLLSEVEWPYSTILEVEGFPSDGRAARGVPRGDPLPIRVRAYRSVPDRARIRISYARETRRLNLAREGESLFVYEHPEVTEPFSFFVEGGDYRSREFRVSVLERPEVQDFAVTLEYPPYTKKAPQTLRQDLGELEIPEGTTVVLEAVATKALEKAWLETEGKAIDLRVSEDDPRHFAGRFAPREGGMVTVNLKDREGVPPDKWLRFVITPLPDKAPLTRSKAVGIGGMITPQALVPLEIRAVDDFGLTGLGVEHDIVEEQKAEPTKGKTPLAAADGRLQVEEQISWDLRPLKLEPDRRLDVRAYALDNDGLRGPKPGYAAQQSFLVVTPERLLEEFLRREEEQRRLLERAIGDQSALRDSTYRFVGEAWKEEGPLKEGVVEEMVRMAKTERQLGRQMASISQAMQLILEEMRNNRIAEVQETERLAGTIIGPLADLADRSLPAAATRLGLLREMAQADDRVRDGISLAADMEAILAAMDRILVSMKRIEGYTEVVNRLRAILKIHSESAEEAARLYRQEIDRIFEEIPGAAPGETPGPSPGAKTEKVERTEKTE